MSTSPTRLLVLGFDAANPDLLRRWANDGTLPNLRALMQRGVVGSSRSIEGFIHSTWPSFLTGVGPDRHGFHYLWQVKPGTYDYAAQMIGHLPFWTHLSRAGRRLAVFDIPLSEPDPDINGMHVVDWGVIEEGKPFRTVPESLRTNILADWGMHPLEDTGDDPRRTLSEFRTLLDVLRRGVRIRAEMSSQYLAQGDWDLFLQVFTESHCAGHHLWHLHEPGHPSHDPAIVASMGDPIRELYVEIDAAMGRLIAAAGDATVLIVTPHAMSHWYGAESVLWEILFRLGAAMRPPQKAPEPGIGATAIRGARALWHLVPSGVRQRMYEFRQRIRRGDKRPSVPSIEALAGSSRCFAVRNGHLTAAIRLNLIGREPSGLLAPGAEADRFVAQLTQDLLEIIDDRTGRPLIRSVRYTRDLHAGSQVDTLPDLLLDWDDELPVGNAGLRDGAGATLRVRSPKIGVVEGTNHYFRTGDHRTEGMFIAAGPGIQAGQLDRDVSVLDFAPTICKLLGVDLPDVDGHLIPEILPRGR